MRRAIFWTSAGLIAHTHAGYPLVLFLLVAARRRRRGPTPSAGVVSGELPPVSLIIAAFDEEEVITGKVADALALDYPRDRLEVIVASDGSADRTVERAQEAGADLVLDLPRAGKIIAQNTAVARAGGTILAFSDANSFWAPDALRSLVEVLADPAVGYVCGEVRLDAPEGDNQEGIYWRYEMAVRDLESRLGGITAGNGAIYALPRSHYLPLPAGSSHDLSFPFQLARRGLRAVYAPQARASERAVPTIAGEWRRKRRMMVGLWDIVIGERMLSMSGYSPLFAFQLVSHRALRYASPFLHVSALLANLTLLRAGRTYRLALAAQAGLLAAAAAAPLAPLAPLRLARYYVSVTASIALGLWDRLRRGSGGTWEKAEGTR